MCKAAIKAKVDTSFNTFLFNYASPEEFPESFDSSSWLYNIESNENKGENNIKKEGQNLSIPLCTQDKHKKEGDTLGLQRPPRTNVSTIPPGVHSDSSGHL